MNPENPLQPNPNEVIKPSEPLKPKPVEIKEETVLRTQPAEPQVFTPAIKQSNPANSITLNRPKTNDRSKIVYLLPVILAIVLLVIIIRASSGIPLEKYTASEYTLKIPKGYDKNESSSIIRFEENGAIQEGQSWVAVDFSAFPSDLDEAYRALVLDYGRQEFESQSQALFPSADSLQDFKQDETHFKRFDAIKANSKLQNKGEFTAIRIFADEGIYSIYVYADKSDPKLAKTANKIINSLEIL